jgi:hypothetical protein
MEQFQEKQVFITGQNQKDIRDVIPVCVYSGDRMGSSTIQNGQILIENGIKGMLFILGENAYRKPGANLPYSPGSQIPSILQPS